MASAHLPKVNFIKMCKDVFLSRKHICKSFKRERKILPLYSYCLVLESAMCESVFFMWTDSGCKTAV